MMELDYNFPRPSVVSTELSNRLERLLGTTGRLCPHPLTDDELCKLRNEIDALAQRLESFIPGYLRISVDGKEFATFLPQATACEPFMVPFSASFIEILGADQLGDLLLAFVALTEIEPFWEPGYHEFKTTAGELEITIRVSTRIDENYTDNELMCTDDVESAAIESEQTELEGWRVQVSCVKTKVLRATEPCFAGDFYPKSEHQEKPIPVTASNPPVNVLVIGVGSSGSNTVDYMVAEGIGPVKFAAFNTDVQALRRSRAPIRLQLGERRTKGRGTGANVSLGREAAWDQTTDIEKILAGADLVFITTGLGGGTGTGAAPVIAKLAKDLEVLTIGVVTTPFGFEGNMRCRNAKLAVPVFRESVDALITISNDSLLTNLNLRTSLRDGFAIVDDVLKQALTTIVDLLMAPGLINIDFADLQTILRDAGTAFFGVGKGYGEARSLASVEEAMNSSFFAKLPIKGAKGMLVSIAGGRDLTLHEVNEAATIVREAADIDANIIFGAAINESLVHQMKVTIVATGFELGNHN